MRSLSVLALVLTAACGGAEKPVAPIANSGPAVTPAMPAGDPVAFAIDGSPWMLDVPAEHSMADEYTHRFTTPAWTIEVVEWPDSQVFIQTADEHVASVQSSGGTILHQHVDGPHDWVVVSSGNGKVSGAISISGPAQNAMCSFDLAAGADWQPAVEACGKVHADDELEEGD